MDPETLHARLDKVQVVDVRYPNEWEAGRINGAVHIPGDYLYEREDELDRDQPIVTVCKSGSRSNDAAEWLCEHGFDAENLDGGMEAWAKAGLDYQAGDGGPGTIAEPEPPPDERPPEMQQLQEGMLDVIFAAQEHFGDHEPNDEEMRGFLRDRLLADGKTPEQADEFLANMGKD